MKQKGPHSLFTARLSGDAKEAQLRIRNISQRRKTRPSPILFLFIVLLILSCCGLVSCKAKTEGPPITEIPEQEVLDKPDPHIVMSTQYYDSIGNYIEVPVLVMPDGGKPNEAISAINLALAEIQEQYQVIPDVAASNQQCIFYPTETDRYINLLLFQTRFFTDLNTGHTVSFVYDKKENRQVTMEDALALVGLTEQDLFHALSAQYAPGYAQSYPNANICIQNHALEAFRLDRDDQPIFYLTARTDDADDMVQDAVSGADHLYIWADGVFTIYEQYNIGEEYSVDRIYPLVSAEETVTMDPPLWNQWYFSGDEPDGGFTVIPLPETSPFDEPLTYLREKMKTLAPNTPLVVDDIWEFNWNGTDAIVVHATNVEITGDESTLYNPGGNHVAPNPPGTDNTVMYTMTTLFVDGCDPVELYYWAYPISSDPGGVSYLPATSGSFQQLYTVTQYAANGQPISCPVFMDHGGELVVRYFKYSPTYFQKDINADGIAEFIFSLDRDNSLMSHYQAYQMIDGAPKFIAITSPLYESVLLGTGEFYLDGNATTLKDYSSYIGADGNTHYRRPEEFCILDLDGDGRTEVVVAINDNQLSLILRESYGTVYGYVRPIRHFNTLTLKQDGTFGWSNSAFYHGIGRLDFSDGADTVRNITYCDFSENTDGSKNEICVVDGERVTYEEYSVAISAENNKPDATWYKLSKENVGLFFD